MTKLLVVLDSNVIISSLLNSRSAPSQIIEFWRNYRFDLLLSNYILTEVKDTLRDKQLVLKYHISPTKQSRLISQLTHAGKVIECNSTYKSTIRDPKDNPIIQITLSGHADYLVTGDQDLLVLSNHKSIKSLKIVTPQELLRIIE